MRGVVVAVCLALGGGLGCGDDGSPVTPDAGPDPDAGPSLDAGPDAGPPLPFAPDSFCPGGPDCPDEGDGVLHVGAGMAEITAIIDDTTDVQTVDVDGDGEFDYFDGDEFDDRDGNGSFDGQWIAGFGNGRAASGVNDPQWARAIALRTNQTTVVLVSLDCVGFFWDDVNRVREMVADLDVDYVAIASTHTHEARDTMGMWGVSVDLTGIDDDHMAMVRSRAAEAIRDAVTALTPARVQHASFRFRDMPGGMDRYVSDDRDPYIVDDEARIMRFEDASTGDTLATLINFGSHPQFTGDDSQLLSSDFPHWLRQGVEEGIAGPDGSMTPGVGGIAVFVNAAIGSQIGNERLMARTWDGRDLDRWGRETAQTVGEQIAYFVLQALGDTGGSVTDETADLAFRNHTFFLDIQNRGFHIAFLTPLFTTRDSYNWDPDLPLIPGENEPDLRTEIAVLDIGRASLLLFPGEADPALFVGGYDGSYTPAGAEVVDAARENPPDLAAAPGPPYLRDLMREDADRRWFIGLANDEIGYFVPEYDYELHALNPYIDEAPGEHYEETVSVGIDAWPKVEGLIRELLAWVP